MSLSKSAISVPVKQHPPARHDSLDSPQADRESQSNPPSPNRRAIFNKNSKWDLVQQLSLDVSTISNRTINSTGEPILMQVVSRDVPSLFVDEFTDMGFDGVYKEAGLISIRGVGTRFANRVLVLVDGIPQYMSLDGDTAPDLYLTSNVEKVEVVKGPASVIYGSYAMAGAINIISQKAPGDGVSFKGYAGYGSSNVRSFTGRFGYSKDGLNVVAGMDRHLSGVDDKYPDVTAFQTNSGYLNAQIQLSSQFELTSHVRIAKYDNTFYSLYSDVLYGGGVSVSQTGASLVLNNDFNHSEGAVQLYYNYIKPDNPDGEYTQNEIAGLMAHQTFTLSKLNTLTAGYDLSRPAGKKAWVWEIILDDNGNPTRDTQISPLNGKRIWDAVHAVYVVDQHQFGNLVVSGGLRYIYNSDFANALIPQLGITWHVSNGTTIRSSISSGYRPPTLNDLYLEPTSNTDLKAERSWNYELSWIQQWSNVNMQTAITGFRLYSHSLIDYLDYSHVYYRNSGRLENTGLEVNWSYHPSDSFDFSTYYSWIHMKYPMNGVPNQKLGISGSYHHGSLDINIRANHIRNLYGLNTHYQTVIIEDGYVKLDAFSRISLSNHSALTVRVENLLDQNYQTKDHFTMPGSTIYGGLEVQW